MSKYLTEITYDGQETELAACEHLARGQDEQEGDAPKKKRKK